MAGLFGAWTPNKRPNMVPDSDGYAMFSPVPPEDLNSKLAERFVTDEVAAGRGPTPLTQPWVGRNRKDQLPYYSPHVYGSYWHKWHTREYIKRPHDPRTLAEDDYLADPPLVHWFNMLHENEGEEQDHTNVYFMEYNDEDYPIGHFADSLDPKYVALAENNYQVDNPDHPQYVFFDMFNDYPEWFLVSFFLWGQKWMRGLHITSRLLLREGPNEFSDRWPRRHLYRLNARRLDKTRAIRTARILWFRYWKYCKKHEGILFAFWLGPNIIGYVIPRETDSGLAFAALGALFGGVIAARNTTVRVGLGAIGYLLWSSHELFARFEDQMSNYVRDRFLDRREYIQQKHAELLPKLPPALADTVVTLEAAAEDSLVPRIPVQLGDTSTSVYATEEEYSIPEPKEEIDVSYVHWGGFRRPPETGIYPKDPLYRHHRLPTEAFVDYGVQPWVNRTRFESVFKDEMQSEFEEFKKQLARDERLKPAELPDDEKLP